MLRVFIRPFRRLFCTKIIKETPKQTQPIQKLNSIKKESVAVGHFFPKQWSQAQIQERLDPGKRAITKIRIIKNRLGVPSGNVLFQFKDNTSMLDFVDQYNEQFIKTGETNDGVQKIIVKPFHLKTNEQVRSNGVGFVVKLSNFDYSLKAADIKKIAADFGKVLKIDMRQKTSERNSGEAFIHFETTKQMNEFLKFADGLPHLGRTLKAVYYNMHAKTSMSRKQQNLNVQVPKSLMRESKQLAIKEEKNRQIEFESNKRVLSSELSDEDKKLRI